MLVEKYQEEVRFSARPGGSSAVRPSNKYAKIGVQDSPKLVREKIEKDKLDSKLSDANKDSVYSYRKYRERVREEKEDQTKKPKRKRQTPLLPSTMRNKLKIKKDSEISPLI